MLGRHRLHAFEGSRGGERPLVGTTGFEPRRRRGDLRGRPPHHVREIRLVEQQAQPAREGDGVVVGPPEGRGPTQGEDPEGPGRLVEREALRVEPAEPRRALRARLKLESELVGEA